MEGKVLEETCPWPVLVLTVQGTGQISNTLCPGNAKFLYFLNIYYKLQ